MADNDLIWTDTTRLVLEANGSAIVAGDYIQADDSNIATSYATGWPFFKFVLQITFGTAPTAGALVSLYQRRLNVINTTDDEAEPADDNQGGFLWAVAVDNVTTAQTFVSPPLPRDSFFPMELWVHNGDSTQSISSGWQLDAIPLTLRPEAS